MSKIFKDAVKNPYNYLCIGKETEELNFLYQKRKEDTELVKHNYDTYKSAIIESEKIYRMAAIIIKELGLVDNPTSQFIVFTYLLWNGYLSENKEYKYEDKNLHNIRGYEELDIISGHGNCRSNVNAMKKIFTFLGYNVYTLINSTSLYYTDYAINYGNDNTKLTDGRIHNEDADESPIGNHANLLLEKNNNYYIYDPTNNLIFKVNAPLTADLYNGCGKCYIKPWGFIIFDHFDVEKTLDILFKIKSQNKENFLTKEEIVEITLNTFSRIKQNKTIISDFYSLIKPSIKYIKSKIK